MALTKFQTSQVEFTQSGTGAQARTLESKLQDEVSVWDFIPPGTTTATTDCASYFQAAIDTGKTVYVPPGSYRIDCTLNLNINYNSLIGHESMPILMKWTEGPALSIKNPSGTSTLNEYTRVENLYIQRKIGGSFAVPNYRTTLTESLAGVVVSGDGATAASTVQFTRLSNLRVGNFAVGFFFADCVGVTVHKCFTQNLATHTTATAGNDAVTFASTAWSVGYYCAAVPYSEGAISPLASIEFVECDDNREGSPSSIVSVSYLVVGRDVRDIFWDRCEATKPQYGWYIDAGATNTSSSGGWDWDIHIFRPIIDAYTINGIYLLNLNGIGAASIVGGYAAGATGGNEAIKIDNCNGVSVSGGFQVIGNGNNDAEDLEDGIRLKNSSGCSIIGNRLTNSRYGISLEASSLCNIHGNIIDAKQLADADSVTLQQAIRLFADSSSNNCSYNTITGNVISGATTASGSEANIAYTYGIIIAASQSYTTVQGNKIDPAQVTNPYSNSGSYTYLENNTGVPNKVATTLASTALALTSDWHEVTADGNALTTITGGIAGQRLIITVATSDLVVTDAAIGGGANTIVGGVTLDVSEGDLLELMFDGTQWRAIAHGNN